MKIKRDKFNSIITREFKKIIQENEELREITLGASPADMVSQSKELKGDLAFMLKNFEETMRESYTNLQNEMNRDPELLKFASQFPPFDGAWVAIGQFIESLPSMIDSVENARM